METNQAIASLLLRTKARGTLIAGATLGSDAPTQTSLRSYYNVSLATQARTYDKTNFPRASKFARNNLSDSVHLSQIVPCTYVTRGYDIGFCLGVPGLRL